MPWEPHPPGDVERSVKRDFARLINAKSSADIAFFHSTSSAMSCAAANILRMGCLDNTKKILVVQDEMASNCYPWQHLATSSGAALHIIPRPDNYDWSRAIIACIDDSVALIALGCVHWCDGSLMNMDTISSHIHSLADPPMLIIDGTQSIGVMPLDVSVVQPDFVACSVHKWLLCPYGLSLAYLHPKHQSSWVPLDHHERNRCGSHTTAWDELGAMRIPSGYPITFLQGACRIAMGGRPPPVILPMVAEGLATVLRYEVSDIQSYLKTLTDALADRISELPFSFGLCVVPPQHRSPHILGVRITSSLSASHICRLLKRRQVHISVRANALRIAPYVYNTPQDISEFVTALSDVCSQLQRAARTILITGGTGYLGQFLVKKLQSLDEYHGSSLHVTYVHQTPYWLPEKCCHHVDFCDASAVHSLISELRPHVVVHLAAISSIAACECDPSQADRINTPVCLIDAMRTHAPSALMLFASTDIVYDGSAPPYFPIETLPTPRNVYAKSKYAFEKHVLRLKHGHVLRLSNIVGPANAFGVPPTKGGTFLQWLRSACAQRQFVGLKTNEVRSFVAVDDVVSVIIALMNRHFQGEIPPRNIWNVGGPAGLSRLSLARHVAETRKVPIVEVAKDCVKSSDSSEWCVYSDSCTNEAIPKNVTMCSEDTEVELSVKFGDLRDYIARYMCDDC